MKRWGGWLLFGLLACDGNARPATAIPARRTSAQPVAKRAAALSASAMKAPTQPTATGSVKAAVPSDGPCVAPSLSLRADRDAAGRGALRRCVDVRGGERASVGRCGDGPVTAVDLEGLEQSIAIGDRVVRHIKKLAIRGRKNGLRPKTLGLVGDSMTVSHAFLRPFSSLKDRGPVMLSQDVQQRLGQGKDSILAFYRDQRVMKVNGLWRDSFSALRAAKIGMRTPWAMAGGRHSPLNKALRLKPAIVVVLYGANDAAYRPAPPDVLADDFERDMNKLLDAIEATGAIAVMNTLARHGDARGIRNCGERGAMTDWRIAVHTNAISRRAAQIACRRQLPLIDLRAGLERAKSSGLGGDGVHLSSYAKGAGVLNRRGLRCGENLRNYLTLRMLARLREILGW